MVIKEQALICNEFHYTGKHDCTQIIGPREGTKITIIAVRRSGKTQIWKRDIERFRVPVKYGLYESAEITNKNASDWHCAEDCPINQA